MTVKEGPTKSVKVRRVDATNGVMAKWTGALESEYKVVTGRDFAADLTQSHDAELLRDVREWSAEYFADRRTEIMKDIMTLYPLGRTDRWHHAVLAWAHRMQHEDRESLRWAFVQFYINTLHQAG